MRRYEHGSSDDVAVLCRYSSSPLPLELQGGHLLLVDGDLLVVEPLVVLHGVRAGAGQLSSGSVACSTQEP